MKSNLRMTLEEEGSEVTELNGSAHVDPDVNHISQREKPMIHPCVDPPVCEECQKLEFPFFDPDCTGCHEILENPNTTVAEIYAILRQWTPQTQQYLETLVNEILKRDSHINDRDGLTDMTLLHYASKSGAAGIGNPEVAANVVSMLLAKGADPYIRCRWTSMTALHYAAYFDVVPTIKVLLKATKGLDIDSPCSEYDNGSALHIAASNLAYEAVKVLLQNGANVELKDEKGRTALDCIPDPSELDSDPEIHKTVIKLKKTLSENTSVVEKRPPPSYDLVQSKVTLQSLGLAIGDKVVVGGIKMGTLRYCGPTEFAAGIWAGIELDEPAGKNDGSIGGISYFTCPRNQGIFAPVSKIAKPGSSTVKSPGTPSPSKQPLVKQSSVDVSHVTSKIDTGLTKSRTSSISSLAEIEVGDRVIVAGQRKGTVKFVGETKFAPGIWYGVELDRPVGKNDGSVNGETYFTCRMKHGVFAPPSRIQKIVLETEEGLGDKRFSSNESLDTISWGAVSEKVDKRHSGIGVGGASGRPKTPVKRPKSGLGGESIMRTPGSSSNFKLEIGMSVFCNNELGVIKYIGPTDFGDGIWVGVELRIPKGKNDGSVQGKRYFHCKPEHGVLVRPSKITVRGINGAKLIADYLSHSESFTNGEVKENGQ
ncbi:hypothetical protein ACJMK2_040479 [Sinanodonta woodiana]|uniref:CAP-Gly domain-containing protein n=2 Tax=Sinanodonta woodiana TaxID=1069815 RepID=A0ABD3W153_SINWO